LVRFGCCANRDAMPTLAGWGFDYAELPVSAVMPEAPDDEYKPQRDKILAGKITPEAYNCFLPGELRIVGPELDVARVESFVQTALRRMAELGGKIVVLGSGGARTVPDGFAEHDARRQLIEFFRMAGDAARESGMVIAIEPLNTAECNIINTTIEGRDLAREVDHTHIRLLADNYHMIRDEEPFSNLVVVGDYLEHIHVSTDDRMAPGVGDYDLNDFFGALKEAGYSERISMECGYNDFEAEAPRGLAVMREKWEAAF
jgi:sugar phosphate isomerase/epimerase